MRKVYILQVLISIFLLVTTVQVAPFATANPVDFPRQGPSPANVIPPVISIASPTRDSVYYNGTLNVSVNVTEPKGLNFRSYFCDIFYKTDGREYVYVNDNIGKPKNPATQFDFNLTEVPFGRHTLTIFVSALGEALKNGVSDYQCKLNSSLSVDFQMHTSPVIIYPEFNSTLSNSSVPLNYTIDHSVNEMAYSLDRQDKIPINGNTTINALTNGQHYIVVYTTDASSAHVDASKTLYFNVDSPEPFPVASIIEVAA